MKAIGILERIPENGYGKKKLNVEGKGWEVFKKKGYEKIATDEIPQNEIERICLELGVISRFEYTSWKGLLWIGDGVVTSILEAYDKAGRMQYLFPTKWQKLNAMVSKVLNYVVLGQCHDISRRTRKEAVTKEETYAGLVARIGFWSVLDMMARANQSKVGIKAMKVLSKVFEEGSCSDEEKRELIFSQRVFLFPFELRSSNTEQLRRHL